MVEIKAILLFKEDFNTFNLHNIQLLDSFIPNQLSDIFCAGQGFNHFTFLCFRNWRGVHLEEEFPAITRFGSSYKYGFHNITRQTTGKNKTNNKINQQQQEQTKWGHKDAHVRKERSHKIKRLAWMRCLSSEQFNSVPIVSLLDWIHAILIL